MKLPTAKKERAKVLVLIGMGVIVLIIVLVQLVVIPILDSRHKLHDDLDEYHSRVEKARRELKASTQIQADFNAVTGKLRAIAENYLLHPILGSYLVGVSEALDPQARDTGLTIEDLQERGIQALRLRAKETSARAYNAYSVQLVGQGSYDEIVAFLKSLEDRNPYVCITELKMSGQPDTPERHRITLRIEWPIEAEPAQNDASAKGGK